MFRDVTGAAVKKVPGKFQIAEAKKILQEFFKDQGLIITFIDERPLSPSPNWRFIPENAGYYAGAEQKVKKAARLLGSNFVMDITEIKKAENAMNLELAFLYGKYSKGRVSA